MTYSYVIGIFRLAEWADGPLFSRAWSHGGARITRSGTRAVTTSLPVHDISALCSGDHQFIACGGEPRPLHRDTFNAHRLMTEHPPVLCDPNKRVVFDVACPAGTVHEGEIAYSRWPALPLLEVIALDGAAERVEVRERVYDYTPATGIEGAVEWHVNFADPRLFTAYCSWLFAQDEMQVAEHPGSDGKAIGRTSL